MIFHALVDLKQSQINKNSRNFRINPFLIGI